MDPTTAKVVTLVVLIVLTLLFGCLPFFLVLRGSRSMVSSRVRDAALACLNCFAGGVFLGTFLLHLLIEGGEEFESYKTNVGWDTDFPFFNLFVASGFFLVALVEHTMHSCLHPGHVEAENREQLLNPEGLGQGKRQGYGTIEPRPNSSDPQLRSYYRKNGIDGPGAVPQRTGEPNVITEPAVVVEYPPNTAVPQNSNGGSLSDLHQPRGLQAFLLLMALSFHTIFDGLAVGLQNDSNEVWQVFGAISVHKSVIAFCLGFEMFKSYTHTPLKAFLWMCMFSLMSPIGIGLGVVLTSGSIDKNAKSLSSGILQGVAAGTFLYVTFLEILCSHMGHRSVKSRFIYILCAVVGFAIMAGVKALDHEH